jgi:hypothetical protein
MKSPDRPRWGWADARHEVHRWTLAELVEHAARIGFTPTNLDLAVIEELARRAAAMDAAAAGRLRLPPDQRVA